MVPPVVLGTCTELDAQNKACGGTVEEHFSEVVAFIPTDIMAFLCGPGVPPDGHVCTKCHKQNGRFRNEEFEEIFKGFIIAGQE
jgi:hypothetical protein